MEYYKIVLLPIHVCTGEYCWDGHDRICGHFDNTGGHGGCGLGLDSLKRDKMGRYPKPKKCLNLKDK